MRKRKLTRGDWGCQTWIEQGVFKLCSFLKLSLVCPLAQLSATVIFQHHVDFRHGLQTMGSEADNNNLMGTLLYSIQLVDEMGMVNLTGGAINEILPANSQIGVIPLNLQFMENSYNFRNIPPIKTTNLQQIVESLRYKQYT